MIKKDAKVKKIALIVQRYGDEIIGGAETLARVIAEQLVQRKIYQIDIYTTAARDYQTWKNDLPAGTGVTENGLTIKRFKTWFPRNQVLFQFYSRLFFYLQKRQHRIPKWLLGSAERLWFTLQGPFCPKLVTSLKKHIDEYEKVILFTYLYYPTLAVAKIAPHKMILVPTAHNEAPFYTKSVRKLLENVPSIIALTFPEKTLIQSQITDKAKVEIAGMGLDFHPYETLVTGGEDQGDFVLYLGRLSRGKHVHELIDNFLKFIQVTGNQQIQLFLAGKKEDNLAIPDHSQIVDKGFISEEEKIRLIQQAKCLINPSPLESLSIIVMEAMAAHTPILINGQCDVLRHYAESTPTVFAYYSADSFVTELSKVLEMDWKHDEAQRGLLQITRDWAYARFSWPKVLDVYEHAINRDAIEKPLERNSKNQISRAF